MVEDNDIVCPHCGCKKYYGTPEGLTIQCECIECKQKFTITILGKEIEDGK